MSLVNRSQVSETKEAKHKQNSEHQQQAQILVQEETKQDRKAETRTISNINNSDEFASVDAK